MLFALWLTHSCVVLLGTRNSQNKKKQKKKVYVSAVWRREIFLTMTMTKIVLDLRSWIYDFKHYIFFLYFVQARTPQINLRLKNNNTSYRYRRDRYIVRDQRVREKSVLNSNKIKVVITHVHYSHYWSGSV